MKYLIIILLFLLFIIFGLPHRFRVKTNLLYMIIYVDYIPILYFKKGKLFIKAIEDALMNHKLDKADLNYLHLLKPIEKVYLNFTHVSNNRLDIDIILISFFENLKNIIPFRLDYVCKNGNDEIIIDLSIIIYLPTFVLNLIKVKGDIKRARKIH